MLWRVRTTLADRPGALALLAGRCGDAEVNILGLQIFPGVHAAVTDELILSTPDGWELAEVAALVEDAGGLQVAVSACTAHALVDGPTNYLLAVGHVAENPELITEALTELLDAQAGPDELKPFLARLDVAVAGTVVKVYRAAPFTVTEEARATAFASVVDDLLARDQSHAPSMPDVAAEPDYRLADPGDASALVRMAGRCSAQSLIGRFQAPLAGLQPRLARRLLAEGPALVAYVGDEIVGLATLTTGVQAEASLLVEDGWQGRGIGTRLLGLAARVAKAHGADELVLQSEHNIAALPKLSAASGLSGRVRHSNGRVVLTVSTRRVVPLHHDVGGAVGFRLLDSAPA